MPPVVRLLHQLAGDRHRAEDPVVALTFDDGPGAATDEVATALARLGVPATFFVVGSLAVEEPGLLDALVVAATPWEATRGRTRGPTHSTTGPSSTR